MRALSSFAALIKAFAKRLSSPRPPKPAPCIPLGLWLCDPGASAQDLDSPHASRVVSAAKHCEKHGPQSARLSLEDAMAAHPGSDSSMELRIFLKIRAKHTPTPPPASIGYAYWATALLPGDSHFSEGSGRPQVAAAMASLFHAEAVAAPERLRACAPFMGPGAQALASRSLAMAERAALDDCAPRAPAASERPARL